MRRRLVSISLLLIVLIIVAGCGNPAQRAGEKAAESLISGATGSRVNVDSSSDSITFEREDGEEEKWTLQEKEVPDSYILPVLPGWQSDGIVTTETDGRLGWVGSFILNEDVRSAADRYEQELHKMGFETNKYVIEDVTGYSVTMTVSGTLDGKYYDGRLSFAEEDGKNVLYLMFGENPEQ